MTKEEKVKAFISQPMNGFSNEEIRENRKKIVKFLEDQGYEVIDSIINDWEKFTAIECLAKSIQMLSDASVVVFAKGWEKARGCVIEHEVAEKYGKRIIYVI